MVVKLQNTKVILKFIENSKGLIGTNTLLKMKNKTGLLLYHVVSLVIMLF